MTIMSSNSPYVTIGVVNYNGQLTIKETLHSLQQLDYKNYEIIVVDDASDDQSLNIVRSSFPNIKIICHNKNLGASAVRNTIIRNSKTNLVFLVDNDITLDKTCLKFLVEEKLKREQAIVLTPRVLLEDKRTIQSDGASMHYIGAAIHYSRYDPVETVKDCEDVMEVDCGSGGMMLLDKMQAERIDLFDEDFRFGWADGEFMLRATLSGFKCFNVPKAEVYHHQKIWGTKRAFYQMRNRWYIILINYSTKTIIMILPMLVIYEILLLCLMIVKRSIRDYFRSWMSIFKNFRCVLRKRKIMQQRKVLPDHIFLKSGSITVDKGLMKNKYILYLFMFVNGLFNLYWRLALRLKLV